VVELISLLWAILAVGKLVSPIFSMFIFELVIISLEGKDDEEDADTPTGKEDDEVEVVLTDRGDRGLLLAVEPDRLLLHLGRVDGELGPLNFEG
jgi:hypothetical protein